MTFEDVFKQLDIIDQVGAPLLKATGFQLDGELGESVRSLEDPAEDIFLRGLTESILDSLEYLHEELTYLKSPACGECRLELFPNGRYGFFDKKGRIHNLTCGKVIEAKIRDRYGRTCWVRSRIEHGGVDYYLKGHLDIPLAGLTVREREVAP